MPAIAEYIKENLRLSFASWSQGQKVGPLAGLVGATVVGLLGSAGIAYLLPSVQRYWPLALLIFFLFLALVVTPFRMWRHERKRVELAEQRPRPKLACFFDKGTSCQHRTKLKARDMRTGSVLSSTNIRIFRARVETDMWTCFV